MMPSRLDLDMNGSNFDKSTDADFLFFPLVRFVDEDDAMVELVPIPVPKSSGYSFGSSSCLRIPTQQHAMIDPIAYQIDHRCC